MPASHFFRARIFHGWFIVAAAFAILFLAYGLQFSYGVFAAALSADLGWRRADTALPYSIYVFVYSLLSAATGRATDRLGPRRVIGLGAVLIGLGWGGSALVQAPWQLGMTLGLVAALGMSVVWVPCNATVARWFSRRRGTAVAIASTGASLGNLLVPPFVALGVQAWGWRPTLAVLALGSAALMGLSARAMARDPEALGLWPDGDAQAPRTTAPGGGSTVTEAIRTLPFWGIVAIYFLTWLVVFVPFVHAPAYARDLGLSPLAAAGILSAIGLGGVVGRLFSGVVSDRCGRFPTLFAICALQALSFLQLIFATDVTSLWLAASVFGLSYGGAVAVLPPLCGDLFGRAHVASVVGVVFAIAGAPAAVGPYLAGWLYDAAGNYTGAFGVAAALNGLAAGLTAWLGWRLRGTAMR